MNYLKNYIFDAIFPRYCLGCSKLIDEVSTAVVCDECWPKIPDRTDFNCAFCGTKTNEGRTCPFCRQKTHLDFLLASSDYRTRLVEKIIKAVKYRFVASLADDIGKFMADYVKRRGVRFLTDTSILITGAPLHRRRLNWRGYNQSELIARKISADIGWRYVDVLARTCNNRNQAEIADRKTRVENAKGVFICSDPETVAGKTIVLVDDVSTTGSTLNDCARALKGAGAKSVIGLVFAR